MPDLEVITEDIRAAGGAAREVADAVRPIDVGAVSEVATAIPGTQAGDLFSRLEEHLAGHLSKVADGFAEIAESMHNAADLYEENEQAAALAMAVPYGPEPGI